MVIFNVMAMTMAGSKFITLVISLRVVTFIEMAFTLLIIIFRIAY